MAASARFPIQLEPPPKFKVDEPASWPHVEGRLEWVAGRLLYVPPYGIERQGVAAAVVTIFPWGEEHPGFFAGGNAAGMLLGKDARGAEGAVSSRSAVAYLIEQDDHRCRVEGCEEKEAELRAKAAWHLERGVPAVWLVLSTTREVVVIRPNGESRHGGDDVPPPHPAPPGLTPAVLRFVRQLRWADGSTVALRAAAPTRAARRGP